MANTESIYRGGVFSTDPVYKNALYGSTGYQANFASLGSAASPFTANQLKEVSEHLNTGVRNIEIGTLKPDQFGSIPKEHFHEIRRLAKLAGAEISFHAPMIDPTGISERGWDKLSQDMAQKQLWDAIQKSADLNPKGNTVVTFHATAGFPGAAETKIVDEKTGKERTTAVTVIDSSGREIGQIGEKDKYFGSKVPNEPLQFDPDHEISRMNEDSWTRTIDNLNFAADRGSRQLLEVEQMYHLKTNPFFNNDKKLLDEIKKMPEGKAHYAQLEEDFENAKKNLRHTKLFLKEAYQNTKTLYDDVYKNASPEDRKKLENYANEIIPFMEKEYDNLDKDPKKMDKFAEIIENGVDTLSSIKHPQKYMRIKEFAIGKSAETVANLAWKAHNELGSNAPILAIENHPSQQALLTSGEELRDVVEKARKNFENIAKEKGMSESEAKRTAEKLIGATWDVGHINQLKMFGFTDEKILKETQAVAPFIKKIHLSDNFGMQNTELPMGMGNVPFAEIMKKVEAGAKGYDIKKVIEAGNWWTEFSQGTKANNPLVPTLSALGTQIYGGGYSGSGPSNWNQMYGIPAGYFGGYGTMLPEQHFSMYGAGFLPLPMELGGQMAQKDRSGTPID